MMTKPTILLLPGFMLDQRLWQDMLTYLEAVGDIAYGDITTGNNIEDIAEHVLAHAPAQFILIGFSMGGMVAQQIAIQAPERVQALILLNTTGRSPTEEEIKQYQGQINLAANMPFKGLTQRALRSVLHPAHQDNKAYLQRMQLMAMTQGKDIFLQQLTALKNRHPLPLATIQCPVCIVASEQDQLFAMREADDLHQAMQQAQCYLLRHSGHMTPLEEPQALGALLQTWIQQLPLHNQ